MKLKIDPSKKVQVLDFRYDEGFRGRVESDIVPTLTCKDGTSSGVTFVALSCERERESNMEQIKIRKLTPLECIRLMGFDDEDYLALRNVGMSDSQIYHLTGDSIVVNVLENIFSQLY